MGGSRGLEEIGPNSGMKERSGGGLLLPLSFLVLVEGDMQLGPDEEDDLVRIGEAARQDGEGIRRVDTMPFLSWSR
jgi:hypothetical protein